MRIAKGILLCLTWAGVLAGCNGAVSPEGRKLLLAANSAYQGGDDAAAVRACSRFLQMHPRAQEAGEAHYVRGLAQARQGTTAAAQDDLLAALRFAKRKDLIALVHAKLGELAYNAGDMAQAETHYRAVLPNTPPGAPPADEAMYRLGCVLQRQGRWQEADQFFFRVIHLFEGKEMAKRAALRVQAVRWSIQAGAYTTVDAAEDLKKQLAAAGLPARIDRELREGRLLRLVRVGSYPTYAKAQADLDRAQRVRHDSFITAAR